MTHDPIFDAKEIAVFRDRVAVEMPRGQAEPHTAMRLISAVLERAAVERDAVDDTDLLGAVLALVEDEFLEEIDGMADFRFRRDRILVLRIRPKRVGVYVLGEEAVAASDLPFDISPVFEILRQAGEYSHFIETFVKLVMGTGQGMAETTPD